MNFESWIEFNGHKATLEDAWNAGYQAAKEASTKKCLHDETRRLGAIWTECTQCGKKWADDDVAPTQEPEPVATVEDKWLTPEQREQLLIRHWKAEQHTLGPRIDKILSEHMSELIEDETAPTQEVIGYHWMDDHGNSHLTIGTPPKGTDPVYIKPAPTQTPCGNTPYDEAEFTVAAPTQEPYLLNEDEQAALRSALRNSVEVIAPTQEPDDAELLRFATEEEFLLFCSEDEVLDIMRTTLQKYRTPPAAPTQKPDCWVERIEDFSPIVTDLDVASSVSRHTWIPLVRLTTPVAPTQEPVIPDGYALISKDVLRTWGKLDIVEDECRYPLNAASKAAPTQEPSNDQLTQLLIGLGHCHVAEAKREYLRVWIRDYAAALKAAPTQEPDYAWQTIEDYEKCCGVAVNDAFRFGWTMGRTTNPFLARLGDGEQK